MKVKASKIISVRKCKVQKYKKTLKKYQRLSEKVKEANAVINLLDSCIFDPWHYFKHGSEEWKTECYHSSLLDTESRNWAFELCKQNIKYMYEVTFGWNEKKKLKELSEDAARFLFLRGVSNGDLVAFSHFRFDLDYGEEVLYCYELHVVATMQRKGIGKFLLGLLELLARHYKMSKVVLTVFTTNQDGIRFYRNNGYTEDCTSPNQSSYLILSKYMTKEET